MCKVDNVVLRSNGMVPTNVDTDARVRTFDAEGRLTGCAKFDFFEDLSANTLPRRRPCIYRQTGAILLRIVEEEFGMEFAALFEDAHRFSVFSDNLKMIAMHNADGTQKYKKGMNQFGHLTGDEFKAMVSSEYVRPNVTSTFTFTGSEDELADSVDWVAEGAVTPVKNQGQCGSCWTFSTTGALESARKIAGGPLTPLSEQQIVSCDTGGNGCGGGSMAQAFDWVSQNGGLCTEEAYPYESSSGTAPSCSAGLVHQRIHQSINAHGRQLRRSFFQSCSF